MKSLRLLILALTMSSALVHAAPVTYYFGGTLSQVQSALAPHFSVGDAFSGSFTFDSSSPDSNPDPFRGSYAPGPAFSATVNGVQYATIGGGGGSVGVDNNFSGSDFLNISSGLLLAEMLPEIGGYLPDAFGFLLQDSSGAAFINDTLPLGGLNLDDFNVGRFEMDFFLSPSAGHTLLPFFASINGELNYLSQTDPTNSGSVPEPGSLALFGLALAGTLVVRHQYKRF